MRRSVLFEAFVVGLFGSSVGIGLGVLLAVVIRAVFAKFGLDLSGTSLVFAPRTFVAAYAVGVLVTLVAAYLPARRTSRIPPVAALRDDVAMPEDSIRMRFAVGAAGCAVAAGLIGVGLSFDVAKQGYWVGGGIGMGLLGVAVASPVLARPFLLAAAACYRRLFGSVGVLAGQNALRNPRRTAATASALMIGLALVTTMTIAGASAKASVDDTVQRAFVGDLVISNLVGQAFSPSIAERAEQVPGVQQVVRLRSGSGTIAGRGGDARRFVLGLEPRQLEMLHLHSVTGGLSLADGECQMSSAYADERGYRVGHTVRWAMPSGLRSYRIVGTYRSEGGIGATCLLTMNDYHEAGFAEQDTIVFVELDRGADPAAVQAVLDEQTRDLPTVTVKNQREFAAEQRAPIDRLVTMIYALLGMALVIAILGVVNTLGLSVIERTREIGLLRAIGLSRAQTRGMVSLESVAIAVLGAVLGVGMGLVFGIALMASLRDQGLTSTRVPVGALAGYVLAAVVIGLLAALLPARRAARLDVLEAISTE